MEDLLGKLSAQALKEAYHTELRQLLGHGEIVRRLDRAYDMLTKSYDYSIEVIGRDPMTFSVSSRENSYTVIEREKHCSCPDAEALCKHRLACRLLMRATVVQSALAKIA